MDAGVIITAVDGAIVFTANRGDVAVVVGGGDDVAIVVVVTWWCPVVKN